MGSSVARTGPLAGVSLLILAAVSPASAQLNNAGTFKNVTNNQTGPMTVVFERRVLQCNRVVR